MKYDRLRGSTSNIIRVFIPDNTSAVGAGLTGLTNASVNLTIAYIRELDSAATVYTGANIETIAVIGTFANPSAAAKCRFKAVDATNFPGLYEIQFHDSATIFGTADASRNVQINVFEVTTSALKIGPNMAEINLTTQLFVKKNTALANFMFLLRASADHVTPKTGEAVTAQRSIDGAAFAACANAVVELANGVYKIDLAATDMNGTVICLKFTSAGADARYITIVTQA